MSQADSHDVLLRGTVPELDQEAMTFHLHVLNGSRVRCEFLPVHLETILEALHGYRHASRLLVQGKGRFDSQGLLLHLESVSHVALLDPLDIAARLEELKCLKAGWFDGKGHTLDAAALDWIATKFEANYLKDLPLPHLYPTPDGGIQAEWTLGGYEASLEIDLQKRQGEWHCLNLQDQHEEQRLLHLEQASDWTWLVEQIGSLAGVQV